MLVRVLVLLLVFGAPVSALAQEDGLSEQLTEIYQEGYETYQRFNKFVRNVYPVRQENSLRNDLMVYWYHENMESRLRWVERQDWAPDYKAMFIRVIEWHKDAFNGGAEKLYRLSRKYLHAPNAKEYGYGFVSGNLMYRAAMAGHAKAKAEYEVFPYQPVSPTWDLSRVYFYKDALKNGRRAINGLALTYLLGTIFDDDLVKGYYWFLRSGHMDVSEKTRDKLLKSISFLSKSERKKAEGWLSSGHIPPM